MNMSNDLFKDFQSAENIDELWAKLLKNLSNFGVTTAFYGITHSIELVKEQGIIESMWFHTDHPEEYRNYFADKSSSI